MKEPAVEAALVKCSTSADVVGSSVKLTLSSVIEEDESPQRSKKATDEEAKKESSARHDGQDIFGELSDLMVTSRELFKDDIVNAKVASPVIEATSALRPLSLTQELTPATKSDIIPKPKSGL